MMFVALGIKSCVNLRLHTGDCFFGMLVTLSHDYP